jgi:hypothetical protein
VTAETGLVQVATTQPQWSITTLDGLCPWPLVGGVCLPQGMQAAAVGCTYTYVLAAALDCSVRDGLRGCSYSASYNLSLRAQALPACEGCGDAPVAVRRCGTAPGGPVGGGPAAPGGCCGDGVCNGVESAAGCPEDCGPGLVDFAVPECVAGSTCETSVAGPGGCCAAPLWRPAQVTSATAATSYVAQSIVAVLVWRPQRQHQGRRVLACVEAFDRAADPVYATGTAAVRQARAGVAAPSMCVLLDVAGCQYCVPRGATLRSIARHYLRNADWLRLYNANPLIPNPGGLIAEQRVHLGPVYTVRSGDTLLAIAGEHALPAPSPPLAPPSSYHRHLPLSPSIRSSL